jgi:hypothetical protein
VKISQTPQITSILNTEQNTIQKKILITETFSLHEKKMNKESEILQNRIKSFLFPIVKAKEGKEISRIKLCCIAF